MGGALVTGLLEAGWTPELLALAEAREERADELRSELGCTVHADPARAADGSDVIVVAVKPQGITELLTQVAGTISPDQVVVSLVAGVPSSVYEAVLAGVPIIRTMPNTPALVGESAAAVAAGRHASQRDVELAMQILGAVGEVVQVAEEQIDAVTAISGSGPAYAFLLAEAMIDAGVAEGLDREVAARLVKQTIKGAGALMVSSEHDVGTLREMVTSPGGTTAAALARFEAGGLRDLVAEAVRAAAARSTELGEQAGGTS